MAEREGGYMGEDKATLMLWIGGRGRLAKRGIADVEDGGVEWE
jgi:hypothetical protein